MDDDLLEGEWFDSKDLKLVKAPNREPKWDEEVSKAVGKPVAINDPRLISLVVKWKKRYSSDDEMDNFMSNVSFLKELKKVFV